MPKTDTGLAHVVEIGLQSEEAAGYRALADASRPQVRDLPAPTPSALSRFGGPAQAAEIVAAVKRIQTKPEEQRHPTEQAFLLAHAE